MIVIQAKADLKPFRKVLNGLSKKQMDTLLYRSESNAIKRTKTFASKAIRKELRTKDGVSLSANEVSSRIFAIMPKGANAGRVSAKVADRKGRKAYNAIFAVTKSNKKLARGGWKKRKKEWGRKGVKMKNGKVITNAFVIEPSGSRASIPLVARPKKGPKGNRRTGKRFDWPYSNSVYFVFQRKRRRLTIVAFARKQLNEEISRRIDKKLQSA